MAINLTTVFKPYTDELFSTESKKALLTNNDFDWTGAHTVKVYKISTAAMTDYGRTGPATSNWSRYGAVASLDATTEEMTLSKDRSFTFAIDKLDEDETAQQLAAASALARQQREVVIPEVDKYVYGVMTANAGTKPTALALTADNIYDEILKGTQALDDAHPRHLYADEAERGHHHGNRYRQRYAPKRRDRHGGRHGGAEDPRLPLGGGFRVHDRPSQRHRGAG